MRLPSVFGRIFLFVFGRNFILRWLSILISWPIIRSLIVSPPLLMISAVPTMRRMETDDPLKPNCVWKDDPFEDLKNVQIYGLIYYGRKRYIDIMNAYLERNLRVNGGVVDGVIFALVKYQISDLEYLAKIQRRNRESYFIPRMQGGLWDVIWRLANIPGAYYLKIDDDVIYIGDGTIAELVREKRRDRFLFISANVVNHGIVSAVHQELAQMPWLSKPKLRITNTKTGEVDYIDTDSYPEKRYLEHGSVDVEGSRIQYAQDNSPVQHSSNGSLIETKNKNGDEKSVVEYASPDSYDDLIQYNMTYHDEEGNHTVLKTRLGQWDYKGEIMLDPNYRIEHTFYSDCIWRRWDCAAWAHESLLYRIQTGTLCNYDFGVFDFHAHGYATMDDGRGRSIDWNINFFVFKYEDFSDLDWNGLAHDDEGEMSMRHPMRRNQHAAALGRALVAHWTFGVQESGLSKNTTLLERYRSLAETLMDENARNFYGGEIQPRGVNEL